DIPTPADTWLTFNSGTNTLSGTPTGTGVTGDITVTAANAQGSVQQVFPITVIDPVVGDGLYAEYWDANNADMATAPDASRVDATVDFANGWNADVPGGINIDSFTARWTGMVKADETGSHRFEVEHDDGASLWVNDVQMIDNYGGGGTHSGTIDLTAGQLYWIELHFKDTGGNEKCHLRWEPPSGGGAVVIPQANLSSAPGATPRAAPVFGASAELTAEDSVGGNDGTLTNMTGLEWRDGRIVGALELDGANDYVALPNLGFSGNVSLSFAAWVNITSAGNENIFGFGTNGTNNTVFSLRTNGATQFHLYFWNNDLSVNVPAHVGTWAHVAAVWDAATTTQYIYFNGALMGQRNAAAPNFADTNYRIGGFNNEYMPGLIDDARIYDRALSGPEVQALYDRSFTTVMPTYGLVTSEEPAAADHTATFMVWLSTAPAADVTISLSSSDTGEGVISGPTVLTFSTLDWSIPQTVTVTGSDDDVDDGDATYTIDLSSTSSADASFDGLDVADVWLTSIDDDTVGVSVTPTTAIVTTEAGPGTATFTVVLTSEPAGPVTVDVESSDTAEGTVSAAQLVFTDLTWNSVRTVTVTGVNDDIDDNDNTYDITFTVSSADGMYDGFPVPDIPATNIDDDIAGITLSPPSGLATTEAGPGTVTFTVVLDSEPTADVTINVSSSNTDEGTVSPAQLVFTDANWISGFTVTVTGVNDDLGDGDVDYYVDLDPIVSADPNYQGRVESVPVTNEDDEPVVYIDTALTVPDAQEHATTPDDATFTVVRESRTGNPVSVNVTVSFALGGAAVRGVSDDYVLYADATPIADATTGFTIPAGGVSSSVIIYVKPQDDDLGEGPESVVFSLVARPDGKYYAVGGPSTDAATILDDEPVVTVAASAPAASEPAAPGAFTVTRTTAFRADEAFDIHFTLAGSAAAGADYVTSPPSPVTIPANEASATVTVVPLDDERQEGDETVVLVIQHVEDSPLHQYTVGWPGQATVTIADDERPGIGGGTGCAPGPAPVGAAGAAWGLVCLAAAALVRRRVGKARSRP
ncbi:MAG: LamG-like jellyroll fold domain-containing protein, partial [Planctomycetota bacterium]